MTGTEHVEAETATDKAATEQETAHRNPTIADRTTPATETTASDNWKIDNEQFRRLAHTGEFAPPPPEDTPQSENYSADRTTEHKE